MRLVLFLTLALLCGCKTRETAKSVVITDQAVEAVALNLQGGSLKTIAEDPGTPGPIREALTSFIDANLLLLNQGRENLGPVIRMLSQGKPVEVQTTTEEARTNPQAWQKKAMRQAVLAEVETDRYLAWHRVASIGAAVLGTVAEMPWWQQLLVMVSGGSLTGAAGLATVKTLVNRAKVAMAETYFRKEIAVAETDEQREAIKERHRKAQEEAGIHQQIARKLAKAKGKA